MRTTLFAALAALVGAAALPLVEGQYTFAAAGVAVAGDDVFRIGITRHPDAAGFPTMAVGLAVREPTVENPWEIRLFFEDWFYVVDNFNTSPGASVETEYFAVDTDSEIDFLLEGTQVAHFITGTGHYNEYTFAVSADLGL